MCMVMRIPVIFSGCPNQEIGWPFLFKGLKIGTSSYFGTDSATEKPWHWWDLMHTQWGRLHKFDSHERYTIAIICLWGMPRKRESSSCVDYVPALCPHRPSLLLIGCARDGGLLNHQVFKLYPTHDRFAMAYNGCKCVEHIPNCIFAVTLLLECTVFISYSFPQHLYYCMGFRLNWMDLWVHDLSAEETKGCVGARSAGEG
jgi:hypothetical protein